MVNSLEQIDTFLFVFLNSVFSTTFLNYFFVAITDARFWIIPGVIAAVLYVKKMKSQAVIILCLAIVTVAISDPVSSQIVKPLVGRHRPCHPDFLVQKAHFLLGFKNSKSFPSSHATNMFALAMLFSLFYNSRWLVFFFFAGIIGYSRIYVGVHYPGDIISGALLGMIIGSAVYVLYRFATYIFAEKLLRKLPDQVT